MGESPRPVLIPRVNAPQKLFRPLFHGNDFLAGVRGLYNEQLSRIPADEFEEPPTLRSNFSTIMSTSSTKSWLNTRKGPPPPEFKLQVGSMIHYTHFAIRLGVRSYLTPYAV